MDMRFRQKGFIQIPIIIAIVVGIAVIGGAGAAYAYVEHKDVSDRIARAERLSDEGSHYEAIELLEQTQSRWLVRSLGVKEAEIKNALQDANLRKQHQDIYLRSLDKLEATDWDDAITLLQDIPDGSFYHDKSLRRIEESKRRLVEEELDAERIARQRAEQLASDEEAARKVAEQVAATEEAARKEAEHIAAREEEARKIAEQVAAEEEEARKAAEQVAAQEEEARRFAIQVAAQQDQARKLAEQQAGEEKVAREDAERRAAQERLAKEQQERQAEKARILELAKTNPLIKAAVSGELKFYIEPLPDYAGTGVSRAVESAARDFSSWKPYGATLRRVYNSNEADLTIAWIRDYGSHTIGESIVRIHIKVGLGTNNCLGDWRAFDANTVKKVLWHELGHSMGYRHSNEPNNVMYYQTTTRFDVEQEVSEVISGGWYHTFPLCSSGSYSYSFETGDSYTAFDLFLVPPGVDANEISSGNGRVYVDCGKEGMHRFTGTCNVTTGAYIYIGNTSFQNAIRLSGNIIHNDNPPWPDMNWDSSAFQYDAAQLTRYRELFR